MPGWLGIIVGFLAGTWLWAIVPAKRMPVYALRRYIYRLQLILRQKESESLGSGS